MMCYDDGEDTDTDESEDTDEEDGDSESDTDEESSTDDEEEVSVTVYMFDRNKFDTPGETDYLTAVTRTTTRSDVATFGVEQIIQGPTTAEKALGMDDTFGEDDFVWFTSESTCGGDDFTISIASGQATVKFCRGTMLAGDMSGGIVSMQIADTVKQFSTVDEVFILNSSGNCFDDMAGLSPEECVW